MAGRPWLLPKAVTTMPGMRDVPTLPLPELTDTGRLGVFQLRRLWARSMARMAQLEIPTDRAERQRDFLVTHGLGLGLEQLARFLGGQPSFEALEDWVGATAGSLDRLERLNHALLHGSAPDPSLAALAPVLSETDLRQWDEEGYVVVPDAAPAGVIAQAADRVLALLGARSDDPESWYGGSGSGLVQKIMVQAFQHPAFEAIRRSPRIAKAFSQLWASDDIWPTTDRVGFNPPERPGYEFPGPHLHWDHALKPPVTFGVQGLVYLTDTPAEQGAFTLVPGFHRRIDAWLKSLPPGADPQRQDLYALGPRPIGGKAGDLVIWRAALPHGASPNHGRRPRLVQYVSYFTSAAHTVPADPRAGYSVAVSERW
jgi:hypothetical protein